MTTTYTAPADYTDEPRPAIKLKAVESSQVKAIGYDEATQTLAVTFTRGQGAIYHYPNVAKATYDAFITAESIGAFFGLYIKPLSFKKYPAEAVAG